jgi:branched-chain amino acid transport system ATP-binding protein
MLEVQDLHTSYGDVKALNGVSLEVPEKSVVALLGRNGMGKTTTVHSIIGFTPPSAGKISFKGQELRGRKPNDIAQMGLALVPQGKRIFPSLTVKENLTVGLRQRAGARRWTLDEVYELFPVLKERANFGGTLLSGGEQQMLAVARAVLTCPDLILMDEPSEGLAPMLVRHLGNIIRSLRDEGLSILLVEQNLGLAMSVADLVYIVNRGEVVYQGTPQELNVDDEVKTRYLGASV